MTIHRGGPQSPLFAVLGAQAGPRHIYPCLVPGSLLRASESRLGLLLTLCELVSISIENKAADLMKAKIGRIAADQHHPYLVKNNAAPRGRLFQSSPPATPYCVGASLGELRSPMIDSLIIYLIILLDYPLDYLLDYGVQKSLYSQGVFVC